MDTNLSLCSHFVIAGKSHAVDSPAQLTREPSADSAAAVIKPRIRIKKRSSQQCRLGATPHEHDEQAKAASPASITDYSGDIYPYPQVYLGHAAQQKRHASTVVRLPTHPLNAASHHNRRTCTHQPITMARRTLRRSKFAASHLQITQKGKATGTMPGPGPPARNAARLSHT